MENPIRMDDLGVSLFLETPTWVSVVIFLCTWRYINPTKKLVRAHFAKGGWYSRGG